MEVYTLMDDIKGEKYREFIEYCLKNSTFFSFTCYDTEEDEESLFAKKIRKYFYKTFSTNIWYYNKTYEKPLSIKVYYSDSSLVDFFAEQFEGLFKNQIKGFEDICFFDTEQVIFASITHENFAEIFPSSQIKPEEFQKFSKWKKRILVSKDYEFLPEFQKFL